MLGESPQEEHSRHGSSLTNDLVKPRSSTKEHPQRFVLWVHAWLHIYNVSVENAEVRQDLALRTLANSRNPIAFARTAFGTSSTPALGNASFTASR